MDIILGRYVEARLLSLTPEQIDSYEAILESDDNSIYDWIIEKKEAPANISSYIVKDIIEVNARASGSFSRHC